MYRALAIAAALGASPVLALPTDSHVPATVTVDWAHGRKDRLLADNILWRCAGDRCTGRVIDRPRSRLRTCRRLARVGGIILSFQLADHAMSEAEMALCNQGAQGRAARRS